MGAFKSPYIYTVSALLVFLFIGWNGCNAHKQTSQERIPVDSNTKASISDIDTSQNENVRDTSTNSEEKIPKTELKKAVTKKESQEKEAIVKRNKEIQLIDIVPKHQRMYYQIDEKKNKYSDTLVFTDENYEIIKKVHYKELNPYLGLSQYYDTLKGLHFIGENTDKYRMKDYLSPEDMKLIPEDYIMNYYTTGKAGRGMSADSSLFMTSATLSWGRGLFREAMSPGFDHKTIYLWNRQLECIDTISFFSTGSARVTQSQKYLVFCTSFKRDPNEFEIPDLAPKIIIFDLELRKEVYTKEFRNFNAATPIKPGIAPPEMFGIQIRKGNNTNIAFFSEDKRRIFYKYFDQMVKLEDFENIEKTWEYEEF